MPVRPWPSFGIGWLFAVIALLLAGAALTGLIAIGGNAVWWAILFLALAILL